MEPWPPTPYAPNLNLIERLWWLLKKTALWNAYYPSFAEFEAAVTGFLGTLHIRHDKLIRLITDQFRSTGVSDRQIVRAWEYTQVSLIETCRPPP